MFCRIQGRYLSTLRRIITVIMTLIMSHTHLVYTPGKSGLAQSTPKLVTATTAQTPPSLEDSIAPPESPLQVSRVPSPAHTWR